MSPTPHLITDRTNLRRTVAGGAVAGMAGGMVMAMFAMVASVTYQHHGFFTPLSTSPPSSGRRRR